MVPPQHPHVSANLHSATCHITTFLNYYNSDEQIHIVLFTIRLRGLLRTPSPVRWSYCCPLSTKHLNLLTSLYYCINYSHVFNSSFVVLMEKCLLRDQRDTHNLILYPTNVTPQVDLYKFITLSGDESESQSLGSIRNRASFADISS